MKRKTITKAEPTNNNVRTDPRIAPAQELFKKPDRGTIFSKLFGRMIGVGVGEITTASVDVIVGGGVGTILGEDVAGGELTT